jgi:hypothetical protein
VVKGCVIERQKICHAAFTLQHLAQLADDTSGIAMPKPWNY